MIVWILERCEGYFCMLGKFPKHIYYVDALETFLLCDNF